MDHAVGPAQPDGQIESSRGPAGRRRHAFPVPEVDALHRTGRHEISAVRTAKARHFGERPIDFGIDRL